MIRKDFSTFRVEHAELRQMGQLGIIGRYPVIGHSDIQNLVMMLNIRFVICRYPLHWHMADQLVAGDSYVANNSIHHTMQVLKFLTRE